MANIRPFAAYRPTPRMAKTIAALPYDVYNRQEAGEVVAANPGSFLAIDRAETGFDLSVDTYAPQVYLRAKELLNCWIQEGRFVQEEKPCYYLYELIMDGRHQTGIVACESIDDYLENVLKKHENTRADKEADRIRHVDTCDMQTGPIFLTYRKNFCLQELILRKKQDQPVYSFVSEDGIGHNVWVINAEEQIDRITEAFRSIMEVYIADGHHRCASAVKVGLKRRSEHPDYTGEEEFNYIMCVLFQEDELKILDYNRVVKDLNGLSAEEFLRKLQTHFEVEKYSDREPYAPQQKGTFGMYLEGVWYRLAAKSSLYTGDAVKDLDVSVLQDNVLQPILGISDPKTDKRIDFVGGIRGLRELERRANTDMKVAFSMYPTSIGELLQVADAGRLMPPKSTWFEPKLRSGLFLHALGEMSERKE